MVVFVRQQGCRNALLLSTTFLNDFYRRKEIGVLFLSFYHDSRRIGLKSHIFESGDDLRFHFKGEKL